MENKGRNVVYSWLLTKSFLDQNFMKVWYRHQTDRVWIINGLEKKLFYFLGLGVLLQIILHDLKTFF